MTTGVCCAKSVQTGMSWPTLSGTAGDLTTLMDALLVNGSATVVVNSITRSGSTATVTTNTAHGMSNTDPVSMRRVFLAGTGLEAEYAGANIATNITDSTHFEMTVTGTPTTPSAGTGMTAKHPGLGWAIYFTGTNKRAYRAAVGNRFPIRIEDAAAGSAAYARVVAYETMTDVDTGTGPFPTAAQVSGGMYIHKSSTANSTTRPWFFIGDEKRFYLMNDFDSHATPFNNATGMFFGDIITYRPSDAYHTLLIASPSSTPTDNSNIGLMNNSTSHYMPRAASQVGTSVQAIRHWGYSLPGVGSAVQSGTNTFGTYFTYPHVMDGGLLVTRIYVAPSTALGIRGEQPGVWCVMHDRPVPNYETWSGTGNLTGKTFMLVNFGQAGGGTIARGCLAFETSDTW